jgi:hypothetical protein
MCWRSSSGVEAQSAVAKERLHILDAPPPIELYLAERGRMLTNEIQHLTHIDETSAIHL